MWWRKPNKPEKPLREQLVEACENVRRQIEIQEQTGPAHSGIGLTGGVSMAPSGEEIAIRELQAELAQLEEALATLGSDDA